MLTRLRHLLNLASNMGSRYIFFRAFYQLKAASGILKVQYPINPANKTFISLEEWRKKSAPFFFQDRKNVPAFETADKDKLKKDFQNLQKGYLPFFNGENIYLGKAYDWITNPQTKFRYDLNQHWSEIKDLDPQNGDIKYVWEKSRFSYLYTIIRHDHHFNEDNSRMVFSDILSWILSNPVNQGPNWVSSQELSLRVLNWIFALYFYKNSETLDEDTFNKILNSIYQQTLHVEKNINFSRIAVRNNHAITEVLHLYIAGSLLPFMSESARWKTKGKEYLEEEGFYQIYDDGSYIQYSMNYHRVAIQLYTWAFYLSKLHKDPFSTALYERVQRSVNFLYQLQDDHTGQLPNYGANDGSLFFPLNSCHFRDFRPQLNALFYYYSGKSLYDQGPWDEDRFWFSGKSNFEKQVVQKRSKAYDTGGYYILRGDNASAFLRCGTHTNRPSQSDNLHLDFWFEGKNILRDAGSFQYNTTPEDLKFFNGNFGHNTVMLNGFDQMEKGGRFIWYYWSQAEEARIDTIKDQLIFRGKINAFQHVKKGVIHERIVKLNRISSTLIIEDIIHNDSTHPLKQIWNIAPEFKDLFQITAVTKEKEELLANYEEGWYSWTYGVKERSQQIIFETGSRHVITTISLKVPAKAKNEPPKIVSKSINIVEPPPQLSQVTEFLDEDKSFPEQTSKEITELSDDANPKEAENNNDEPDKNTGTTNTSGKKKHHKKKRRK